MANKFLVGFKIFLSGVTEADQAKAQKVIKALGGVYCDRYSEKDVNCLLVRRVGSVGYAAAQRAQIRTLVLQWLFDCYSQKKLLTFKLYEVKPFQGLHISCTQLLPEDRFRVQRIVEENGGSFASNLVKGQCTHLVAVSPHGEKYNYAKSWRSVMIISIDWVLECARVKGWVSELKFLVRKAPKSLPDPSKVSDRGNGDNGKRKVKVPGNIVQEVDKSLLDPSSGTRALRCLFTMPYSCDKLRGQLFWVHGYSREVSEMIAALIVAGGGRRSMMLYEGVTVVLLGPDSKAVHFKEIASHPCDVYRRNLVWLIEQLFTVRAVLRLMKESDRFSDLIQFISKHSLAIESIDDLVGAYKRSFYELESLDDVSDETASYKKEMVEPKADPLRVPKLSETTAPTMQVDIEHEQHRIQDEVPSLIAEKEKDTKAVSKSIETLMERTNPVEEVGQELEVSRGGGAIESDSVFLVEEDDPFFGRIMTFESMADATHKQIESARKDPTSDVRVSSYLRTVKGSRIPLSRADNLPPPMGQTMRSHLQPRKFMAGEEGEDQNKRRRIGNTNDEESQQIFYRDENIEKTTIL